MIEIKTKEELQEAINNNKEIVVKWGAEWCSPCKMLEKTLSEMNEIATAVIDVESCDQSMVEEYSIQNVPVLDYFINGEKVNRTIGNIPAKRILEVFNK